MPLVTYNVVGAWDTRDLISTVTFTFTMRRHLIRLASAPFIPPVWQRLVGFGFRVQRMGSTMQNLRRVGQNSDPQDHSSRNFQTYFPTPFSDCLCHVSFRRYSPLSLEVVEKRSKCKSFLAPNFCGRDGSDFCTAVC